MKGPVFARTRLEYQSYSDFWRLVEISGLERCWTDEIDLSSETFYVFSPMNGAVWDHLKAQRANQSVVRAKVAYWLLERNDAHAIDVNRPFQELVKRDVDAAMEMVDHIWSSDRHVASLDPRITHVVMGSHPGLGNQQREPFDHDVAHMSYVHGRREGIMASIQRAGVRIAPNAWADMRDWILKRSAAMLNVHQTPAPIGEPLRFALAAAYAMPLFSETMANPWPLVEGEGILMASAGGLPERVREWLAKPDLQRLGENLFRKLCVDTDFERSVVDGMKRTLSAVIS